GERPMCWFLICPKTGKHLEQFDRPDPSRKGALYLLNGAFDAFFDDLYAFREFLAPLTRPVFRDLIAFVIDGTIPESMVPLVGLELSRHHQAMQRFWTVCNAGEDGYPALLGREMLRQEKYWLVQFWVWRTSVGREQFYPGKAVARQEWLV